MTIETMIQKTSPWKCHAVGGDSDGRKFPYIIDTRLTTDDGELSFVWCGVVLNFIAWDEFVKIILPNHPELKLSPNAPHIYVPDGGAYATDVNIVCDYLKHFHAHQPIIMWPYGGGMPGALTDEQWQKYVFDLVDELKRGMAQN